MDDIPVYTPYVCTGFVYITETLQRRVCSITRRLDNDLTIDVKFQFII